MPPQGQNGDHRVGLKEILGKKYYSMLNVRSPFSRLNIGFSHIQVQVEGCLSPAGA